MKTQINITPFHLIIIDMKIIRYIKYENKNVLFEMSLYSATHDEIQTIMLHFMEEINAIDKLSIYIDISFSASLFFFLIYF